jgi:hypothetical protein
MIKRLVLLLAALLFTLAALAWPRSDKDDAYMQLKRASRTNRKWRKAHAVLLH